MFKDIADLQSTYRNNQGGSSSHQAEMRVAIRLRNGLHWNSMVDTIQQSGKVASQGLDSIQITKNHLGNIIDRASNSVMKFAPDAAVAPRSSAEHGDIKTAEISNSVLEYLKEDNAMQKKLLHFIKDASTTGETYALIKFQPDAGEFIGYETEVDPVFGMPIPDSHKAVFSGRVTCSKEYGFNVHLDLEADCFEQAKFATVDKLHWKDKLESRYKDSPEKLSMIKSSTDNTYKVFNGLSGSYALEENHVMIHETYVRPCPMYPKGQYFFWMDQGILEQGELLCFPLFQYNWKDADTSARGFGLIRDLKQTQLEINRIATQAVKESVTLGYSLLLTQLGTKLTQESFGNGMRTVYYQGAKPEVIDGKNGEQYLQKIKDETNDLYTLANLKMFEEEENFQGDVMAMLTSSMKQKAKFKGNGIRFQKFVRDIMEGMLKYARAYLDHETIIPMIGKNEVVNISEFKNSDPLSHQIKIIDSNSDVDTALGRSLQATQLLQYAGSKLNDEQLGLVIQRMPWLDSEALTSEFTKNLRMSQNIILALDRGEFDPVDPEEPHEYIINKLVGRKKESSFKILPPQIKQMYEVRLQQSRQLFKKQQEQAQRAKDGHIPTGGFVVPVQMYGAGKDGKSERLKLPVESLYWLVDELGKQKSSQERLNAIPLSQQAALQGDQGMPQQGMPPQGMPPMMPNQIPPIQTSNIPMGPSLPQFGL